MHERLRIAATCGVICVRAKMVCDSSTGGLVRAGLTTWIPKNKTTTTMVMILRTLIIVSLLGFYDALSGAGVPDLNRLFDASPNEGILFVFDHAFQNRFRETPVLSNGEPRLFANFR